MTMRRLEIGNIKLPRIYVVDDKASTEECKENGIPYIVWHGSNEELAKIVLYPTLSKMFPGVKWKEVLGISGRKQVIVEVPGRMACGQEDDEEQELFEEVDGTIPGSDVSEIATDAREFDNGGIVGTNDMKLDDYVGDLSAVVNIEELQALHLLPSFMDDIATNIRKNIYNLCWWEGYNKKLGVPIGNFDSAGDLPNLMILDISGSIPRSIAATMLSLIDTLRNQANADLIITAGQSRFYPIGSSLPSPQQLRSMFSLGNESLMFNKILKEEIKGRKFGNVISFGDNDCPSAFVHAYRGERDIVRKDLEGIEVHHVWHYHTHSASMPTGYAKWADGICAEENIHHNKSWCSIIKSDEQMRKEGLI